jgi:transposase-like protein
MTRENREVWAKRVERLGDSGLTAKEFAAEIGVNANTLAGWKWRLGSREGGDEPRRGQARRGPAVLGIVATQESRTEGCAPAARERRTPRRGTESITPMKFVELTTRSSSAPAPAPAFEIVLRSGRTVRVPGGFDAGELARLVGVLEEARS